ncbi:hypothetical protein BOX15_Mlig021104g1, partial [Macrostomum lignano]
QMLLVVEKNQLIGETTLTMSEPLPSFLSEWDLAEMKEAFSMLDNTGTLRIPASMLVNAALQVAECPDPKQVFQHVQQTRLSPQGSIDFNKFVGFMCGMVPYERPRDRLISCLKVLALNTRTISRDLLRRSLMSFGATMPEEEIDELLAGVPADADGNIDIHRMADFLLS